MVDQEFVLGSRKFPISGFNVWEVVEAGTGANKPEGRNGFKAGQAYVDEVMEVAAKSGFTVVRIFAHGVTKNFPSMDAQGNINEKMMKGLDYVVNEAYKRGIKLILSFTSNWTPAGGVDFYAEAVGGTHNDFFTNEGAKNLYKKYMAAVLQRKNTLTGRTYSDEPTIMAFNLINEPVCRNCEYGVIARWVEEMAKYFKSLDKNHLLTVGEEGFYHLERSSIPANPSHGITSWPTEWRQDFIADHSFDTIDFTTFHAWPDNWADPPLSAEFFQQWIDRHATDSAILGKPCILEEFGKEGGNRAEYFRVAYDSVKASLERGGSLKGAMFWQFYTKDQEALWDGGGPGPYGVYETDTAFQIAVQNARDTKDLYTDHICSLI